MRLCSSDFSWTRRPRFHWIIWKVRPKKGLSKTRLHGFVNLSIRCRRPPVEDIVPRGYQLNKSFRVFPTWVRAIPRKRPPPSPAGLHQSDHETRLRWTQDGFRFPPYQYQEQYCLTKVATGDKVTAPAVLRELSMFYDRDHTFPSLSAGERTESGMKMCVAA